MSRSGVALVIGSGGVKCAASIGLMRCLHTEDIPTDLVVGCNGGAIFAAANALGTSTAASATMITALRTRAITAQPDRRAMLSLLFPKWFGFDGRFGFKKDTIFNERLAKAFCPTRDESEVAMREQLPYLRRLLAPLAGPLTTGAS